MKYFQAFLELLFPTPRICPFCHTKQEELQVCFHCLEELKKIKEERGQCARCGTLGVRGEECGNCFYWPQYFLRNYAAIPYEGKWRQTIHQLKFKNQGWLATPLAEIMIATLKNKEVDLVLPVPLHKDRLRTRGFNQASLLGQEVARITGLPFNDQLLERVIATSHQSGLSQRRRASNVRNAFQVNNSDIIAGKRILLVDDLMTSGATLLECSKVLYGKGAKTVTGVTLGVGVK
ncbi:MAG: ComF family protein [Clostridia bacterium]|jgi:competence protein ComFC|nr:ComF family protein [Clostridia bacterium]